MLKNKDKIKQQKLKTFFGVKINTASGGFTQKVDDENRIVKAVGNTYFYIDSDYDMLVSGCCSKSISDRGPLSSATAKIKHQSDHVLNTKNVVGRLTVLEERVIEGKEVLYFESFIPETTKGNDDLENYKQDIYDNHSIGFRYKNLVLAIRDSEEESERKAWEEFYPRALNPEKADEYGFFWVVKEVELFEISVVSFGANRLTPNLTGKSEEENTKVITNIIERIDFITEEAKANKNKAERNSIEMEALQLKQLIADLDLVEPSKKSTLDAKGPGNTDTLKKEEEAKKQLFTQFLKPKK